MSNISEKAGNATDGAVGQETLIHQTQTLASHSLEYAKGLTGLGSTSKTSDAKDTVTDSAGGQTLGGLVNEGRDLAGAILGSVAEVVKTKTDEAKAAVDDQPQAKSYVDSARDTAAGLISTAEGYIKTAADKAEETANTKSTNDLKADASSKADEIVNSASSAGKELKSTAEAYATTGLDHTKATAEEINAEAKKF